MGDGARGRGDTQRDGCKTRVVVGMGRDRKGDVLLLPAIDNCHYLQATLYDPFLDKQSRQDSIWPLRALCKRESRIQCPWQETPMMQQLQA